MSWRQFQQFQNFCSSYGGGYGDGKASGGWKGGSQGGKGGSQGGKGGSQGGKGGQWRTGTPAGACKCCGREGHYKAQCHHKDKECGVCGKIGHIKAVCRHKDNAAGQPSQQTQKVAAAPVPAATAKCPWYCLNCGATNPDDKLKKCHGCKAFRKKEEEDTAASVDKTALSPATVKIIEATKPDKLDEETEQDERELEYFEAVVHNCAQWSERSPISRAAEDQAKRRIAELKEKLKKTQSPDNKVVKSIMGDSPGRRTTST